MSNFQERISAISDWLSDADKGVLRFFTRPRNLDDKTGYEMMKKIALAVNAVLPNSVNQTDIMNYLNDLEKVIDLNYDKQTWPSIKVFTDSAYEVVRKLNPESLQRASGKPMTADWKLNVHARRIENGALVGEEWLFEPRCSLLLEHGLVTNEMICDRRNKYLDSLTLENREAICAKYAFEYEPVEWVNE